MLISAQKFRCDRLDPRYPRPDLRPIWNSCSITKWAQSTIRLIRGQNWQCCLHQMTVALSHRLWYALRIIEQGCEVQQ
jgi:hypothetical protein